MTSSRKGISPIVAVIMLIAFTLVMAGMLAMFVTQLTENQQKSIENCIEARVMLKRGVFTADTNDPTKGNLTLTTYNYGKVPLRFQSLLSYSNETRHPAGLEIYPGTFDVGNGKIEMFTLYGVSNDLLEATIKSVKCDPPCYECTAAQDFLKYIDMKGLGYV